MAALKISVSAFNTGLPFQAGQPEPLPPQLELPSATITHEMHNLQFLLELLCEHFLDFADQVLVDMLHERIIMLPIR